MISGEVKVNFMLGHFTTLFMKGLILGAKFRDAPLVIWDEKFCQKPLTDNEGNA